MGTNAANDLPVEPDVGGLWRSVARQLHHPRGNLGAFLGRLMAVVNAGPNRASIEALEVDSHSHVLELGFGPGEALRVLVRQAPEGLVCGLDQSEKMLQQAARRNLKAIEIGQLKLINTNFESLPFSRATFDKVLAVNTAYFFSDDGRELAEIHRVLRPGGRLVLYVTDRRTMEGWPFARAGGHRLFSASELRSSLTAAGFSAEQVKVELLSFPLKVDGLLGIAERL